MIFFIVSMIK